MAETWYQKFQLAYDQYLAAKALLAKSESTSSLEQSLRLIDKSLLLFPLKFSWRQIKIELLLSLDREKEAFFEVRWLSALMPSYKPLQKLIASKKYQVWLKGQRGTNILLPKGLATVKNFLPPGKLGAISERKKITPEQWQFLSAVRFGADEWLRSRNQLLINFLHWNQLPLEQLFKLSLRGVDLQAGILPGHGLKPFSSKLLKMVQHFIVIKESNRYYDLVPSFSKNRELLLPSETMRTLKINEVNKLLNDLGKFVGCPQLSLKHFGLSVVDSKKDNSVNQQSYFASLLRQNGLFFACLDAEMNDLIDHQAAKEIANTKGQATVLGSRRSGENTYYLYSYRLYQKEYLFAYLTPYDEVHRAFGDHPKEWYDSFAGTFEIIYAKDNPQQHVVSDSRFLQLNGRAQFIATAKKVVKELNDIDNLEKELSLQEEELSEAIVKLLEQHGQTVNSEEHVYDQALRLIKQKEAEIRELDPKKDMELAEIRKIIFQLRDTSNKLIAVSRWLGY